MPSRGQTHTEEAKKKISISLKEFLTFNEHPRGMDGKHHSTEVRFKISKSLKEHFKLCGVSEETRLKMSKAAIERWLRREK